MYSDVNNMSTKLNPILDEHLFTEGKQFMTVNGKDYGPGNYLWHKYNGEYHTHVMGQVCAGPNNKVVMDHNRLLYRRGSNKTIKPLTDKVLREKQILDEVSNKIKKTNLSWKNKKFSTVSVCWRNKTFETTTSRCC